MGRTMPTKIVLRRIEPLSLAKISGLLYAIGGLIAGAFVSLFSLAGAASSAFGTSWINFGSAFGVAAIILLPVLYGVMGFIGGLIGAAVFNLVVGWVGGLEIETDQTRPTEPGT
jgi:hypothetical protein